MAPPPSPTSGGDADPTKNVQKAASRLWGYYRDIAGFDPDILKIEEMDGDQLEEHMGGFCNWASSIFIPKRFNEQLQPTNPQSTAVLGGDTILIYMGKYLLYIRRYFEQAETPLEEFDKREMD